MSCKNINIFISEVLNYIFFSAINIKLGENTVAYHAILWLRAKNKASSKPGLNMNEILGEMVK